MKRSYKQNCALAHAMDVVGERWTLLIVRELLVGPRRYGELLNNLSGIGTNLLADRLKELEAAELIAKEGSRYLLTENGRQLESVVNDLVRFGLSLGIEDMDERLTRPEWDVVALRAIYDEDKGRNLLGRYVLVLNGEPFRIEKGDSVRQPLTIAGGDSPEYTARVSLTKPIARRLADGRLDVNAAISSGEVEVQGSAREAKRLLSSFGMLPRYAFVDA